MKCSKAQELIGDLLDGTIGPEDKAELEKHCDDCRDCREVLEDFRTIAEKAKGLAKFEPSEAVWPRILSGVRADRREKARMKIQTVSWPERLFGLRRPSFSFVAALAVLVVVGGVVMTWKPWKAGSGAVAVNGEAYTLAKLKEAENHYREAIQALTEAVSSQKGKLDPQMAALLERDLKVIDEAIVACRNAVTENPASVNVHVYLLGAYREKVEFLDNMIDVQKTAVARDTSKTTI